MRHRHYLLLLTIKAGLPMVYHPSGLPAVSDSARNQGLNFAYLHKWVWLNSLSKPSKDTVTDRATRAHLLLALAGGWLWRRRA